MTAEELLAAMAEPFAEGDGYCTIDPETRVITIPPEYQLLGVESDEKAERLYFKCPKIVGDNIDLSKLALRVNFRCTAEKNKIILNELVAQNLDARVNKLEIDNAALAEQTIIVE